MSGQSRAELPNGWAMARVGDILKVRSGYAFKSSDYKPEGIPLIRQSDLGDDVVTVTEAKRVDSRFLSELPGFIVRYGDLLIGMSGSLGKIARYQHDDPALQNQRTGLLVLDKDSSTKFAKLALQFVEPQILAGGKGIAVQNVSGKEIEDCLFPLPPFAEQERIASFADELFSDLDAGVAALERVRTKLRHYRAAVLKAAVEGALTAEWRKQHPATEPASALLTRILAERRRRWEQDQLRKFAAAGKEPPLHWKAKYKEPVAPDTSVMPPLPEGWSWASVEQVLTIRNGCAFPSTAYCTNGIALIRQADLQGRAVSLENAKRLPPEFLHDYSEFIVSKGDLLIGMSGSLGKVSRYNEDEDALQNQRTGLLQLSGGVTASFAELVMHCVTPELIRRGKGIAVQNVSSSDIHSLCFPMPPLAEQEAIVEAVEDQLSVIEYIEADVAAKLKSAQALRQSILRHAFTGQLVPQDPHDEPASELLKRIAADRDQRTRLLKTAKAAKQPPAASRGRKKGTP